MPERELRRTDREMSFHDSEALLERALVCRVGTISPEGAPYVVPMNFVYEPELRTVLLHSAASGRLLDNLAANPRVCVEVDEPGDVIATGETACETSQVYSSVICSGRAQILSGDAEKRRLLEALVRKYVDRLTPARKYDPDMSTIDNIAAIRVDIHAMTGKRRSAT